ELKGFGLKVTKRGREKVTRDGPKVTRGGEKTYILQYRKRGSRFPLRYQIGRHGDLAPGQARKEATRLLGAIAYGEDLAAFRPAEKAAHRMAALAERFLVEHVATKTKSRTAAEYRRLLKNIILPAIGRKRVRDVTRVDICRLHHERRDTPYDANRALAVLSKMF